MKVARVVFAVAAALIVSGVVVGAIPHSTVVTSTTQSVACGSAFFPKDQDLLVVPRGVSRSLTAEDCDYATSGTTAWVLIGLGALALALGVAVARGQRKETAPVR